MARIACFAFVDFLAGGRRRIEHNLAHSADGAAGGLRYERRVHELLGLSALLLHLLRDGRILLIFVAAQPAEENQREHDRGENADGDGTLPWPSLESPVVEWEKENDR